MTVCFITIFRYLMLIYYSNIVLIFIIKYYINVPWVFFNLINFLMFNGKKTQCLFTFHHFTKRYGPINVYLLFIISLRTHETGLILPLVCWSVCTSPGKLVIMYRYVRGIDFVFKILELFWQFFVFFILFTWWDIVEVSHFSAISWWKQVTFDEMTTMSALY
jgi:hypothetical protein